MPPVASLTAPLRAHPPLLVAMLFSTAIIVVASIGLLVDDRVLVGAPIWLKSWKFGVSITIYTATIAWMLSLLARPSESGSAADAAGASAASSTVAASVSDRPIVSRRLWWIGTVIAVCISLENILIALQIVRGKLSHYNFSTPFDSTIFVTMGAAIVAVWIANLFLGLVLAVRSVGDPVLDPGIRWGVGVSLLGMAVAFLMTIGDLGVIEAPGDGIEGAHTVGAADGGPGLPVTGWSTEVGDLRVPHFVGIHALQALQLFALFLTWSAAHFSFPRRQSVGIALVRIAGASALTLVVLLTWQAARGQSVVRPDLPTLLAFAALVLGSGIASAFVLRREASASPPSQNPSKLDS